MEVVQLGSGNQTNYVAGASLPVVELTAESRGFFNRIQLRSAGGSDALVDVMVEAEHRYGGFGDVNDLLDAFLSNQ